MTKLKDVLDTPPQTILWHAYQHVNQMYLGGGISPMEGYRATHHALSLLLDALQTVNATTEGK